MIGVLHTSTETNLLFSTEDLIVIITIARLKKTKTYAWMTYPQQELNQRSKTAHEI